MTWPLEPESEETLSGDSQQELQELAMRISSTVVDAKQQACPFIGPSIHISSCMDSLRSLWA